jgi:hypothetical protein
MSSSAVIGFAPGANVVDRFLDRSATRPGVKGGELRDRRAVAADDDFFVRLGSGDELLETFHGVSHFDGYGHALGLFDAEGRR